MKILLFLTSLIYSCNGGISSGYAGNSVQEIEIEPQQLQHLHHLDFVEQGHHNGPTAPLEIINVQSVENGEGYGGVGHGYSGGQSEWQPIVGTHSHSSEPQIIKIIHEYSDGRHHGGNGFGGQSQPQIIKIIEEQSYDSNHIDNGASFRTHQIEDHSYGGHGGNAFGKNLGGHGSPSSSEPQIIFADPPSTPFGPRTGSSSKSSNPLSSLGSLIPQFIRLLFGGGDSKPSLSSLPSFGGHRAINFPNTGQLTNAYGYGGTAKITRGGKHLNSFFKTGRVIESGTLKISQIKKGGK